MIIQDKKNYYFETLERLVFLLTNCLLWELGNSFFLVIYIVWTGIILLSSEEAEPPMDALEGEDFIEKIRMYGDNYTEIIMDPEFLAFYEEIENMDLSNDLPHELSESMNSLNLLSRQKFLNLISADPLVDYCWEINYVYNYIFKKNNKLNMDIGLFFLDSKNYNFENLDYLNYEMLNFTKNNKKKNYKFLMWKVQKINKKILMKEYSSYGLHLGSFINFLKFQTYDYLDNYNMENEINKNKKINILSEFLDIRNSNRDKLYFNDLNIKPKNIKSKYKINLYNNSSSYLNLSFIKLPKQK